MKRLILVRHGSYGCDDHLNDSGREQISGLSERIKESVNGQKVAILTSVAARARESAEILGKIFGVEIEAHDVLWSENRHPEDLSEALRLVRSKKESADVLILVTHLEYVEQFPHYFGKEELGTSAFPRYDSVPEGEAWDIDCERKTRIQIR